MILIFTKIKIFINKYRKGNVFIYLLFLLIAIIAFWNIFLLRKTFLWDMFDCYLPWKYYVGECIQSNIFPFWNPYQLCGYPFFGDLRSAFYPEYWLIAPFFDYSIYTLHILYVFYVSVSGYSMYRLSNYLFNNKSVSYCTGLVFMLSGLTISQGQEFSIPVALSFIPFALMYYLKLIHTLKPRYILYFCIFLYLSITGSYPAVTIILCYFILTIALAYIIKFVIGKQYKNVLKFVLYNICISALLIILCLSLIFTLYQAKPFVERFTGLDISKIMTFPFTPQSLLSLIWPLATTTDHPFFDSNLTMNNLYFGIVMLLFFIWGLFQKKTFLLKIFMWFGLFCLLASFGPYTPVRKWLFYYFPMMDAFRCPSFFRPFVLIAFVLISAQGLKDFYSDNFKFKKFLYFTFGMGILITVVTLIAFTRTSLNFTDYSLSLQVLKQWFSESDIFIRIIIQSFLQLGFLLLLLLILFNKKLRKNRFCTIPVIITTDLIVSVWLNSGFTLYDNVPPKRVYDYIKSQPSGFPVPELNPVAENTDKESNYFPLWRNTNMFTKKISAEGFNSFLLHPLINLENDYPLFYQSILKNPFIYFSDKILPLDSIDSFHSTDSSILFLNNCDFNKLVKNNLNVSEKDTLQIIGFSPVKVILKTSTQSNVMLNMLQSYYPGWNAFIDGEKTRIFVSNIAFQSINLPKGVHSIRFEYKNKPVFYSFWGSIYIFILLICLLIFSGILNKKMHVYFLSAISPVLIISLLYIINKKNDTVRIANKQNLIFQSELKELFHSDNTFHTGVIINSTKTFLYDSLSLYHPDNFYLTHLNKYVDENELSLFMKNFDSIIYFSNESYNPPEIAKIAEFNGLNSASSKYFKTGEKTLFIRNSQLSKKPVFDKTYDLIKDVAVWHTKGFNSYDSVNLFKNHPSVLLDSITIYTPPFHTKLKDMGINGPIHSISVLVNFKKEKPDNESYLVIQHVRNNVFSYPKYLPLNIYSDSTGWSKAIFSVKPDDWLRKNNRLYIFVWNAGKSKINIGDVRIIID